MISVCFGIVVVAIVLAVPFFVLPAFYENAPREEKAAVFQGCLNVLLVMVIIAAAFRIFSP